MEKKARCEMVTRASMYLNNSTADEVGAGGVMDAFTLSFAMEILSGMPKENCLTKIMERTTELKEQGLIK